MYDNVFQTFLLLQSETDLHKSLIKFFSLASLEDIFFVTILQKKVGYIWKNNLIGNELVPNP